MPHRLTSFEAAAATLVLFIGCAIIIALIALSYKVVADAKVNEAEESVNRRADRMARQMMRDRLDGLQIQVVQKIVVVDDDLKGGKDHGALV